VGSDPTSVVTSTDRCAPKVRGADAEVIRVVAHAALSLRGNSRPAFSHPLARRMTVLQRAVVEVVLDLEVRSPDVFASGIRESGAPVYFGTSLGEFASNLALLGAFERCELPLSPTSFQHSVHNCPAGYLSIVLRLCNPMTTLAGGADVGFKALRLAETSLRCDPDSRFALVVVADETHVRKSACGYDKIPEVEGARSEAFLLAKVPAIEPSRGGTYLQRRSIASGSSMEVRSATCVVSIDACEIVAPWQWILGPSSVNVACDAHPETRWIPLWRT
jgi:hypothetical protein